MYVPITEVQGAARCSTTRKLEKPRVYHSLPFFFIVQGSYNVVSAREANSRQGVHFHDLLVRFSGTLVCCFVADWPNPL